MCGCYHKISALVQGFRGGWKLVISDRCEIVISAMPNDNIIILTAIEAHSERSTRFTQTAFVCLGQNSLSGYVGEL